jgi:defect in organelle trafficking protein DotD
MKKTLILIPLIGLLASCAYTPKFGETQLVAEPNPVDLMLADAADRSTRALETLAAMEQTKMPIKAIASVPNAPQELQRAVTFNWTGPVEPLVEELTRKAGYNYGVIGAQPPSPIIITMRAENKPLINVLRDIGMQMGARADLNVDAQMQAIEIQYAAMVNKDTQ